ncbi:MAG: DUF3089 domain-containing protein, partial [Parvularculaceae bacterium]|nr:DUF3089 domain-containing protein [Parvularculaceae bacterium]
ALADLRSQSRVRGVEGLMLKHRDAAYGSGRTKADGVWWKWKVDALTIDGVAARRLAYADVRRAFETFLRESDPQRPIILVGYEQGGLHALGLLQEFFQKPPLSSRLAAAYVIGQPVPLDAFDGPLKATPPCRDAQSVRCIVSYVDIEARFPREIERSRSRALAWDAKGDLVATAGRPALCVNPLSWTATAERLPRERQIGAASATGIPFGQTPPKVADAVGAQCVDGVLKVDRPDQDYLRRRDWLAAKWRAQHFNLFYFDLAENAARRAAAAAALRDEEAKHLKPIEDSVDIVASPINKTRY